MLFFLIAVFAKTLFFRGDFMATQTNWLSLSTGRRYLRSGNATTPIISSEFVSRIGGHVGGTVGVCVTKVCHILVSGATESPGPSIKLYITVAVLTRSLMPRTQDRFSGSKK